MPEVSIVYARHPPFRTSSSISMSSRRQDNDDPSAIDDRVKIETTMLDLIEAEIVASSPL